MMFYTTQVKNALQIIVTSYFKCAPFERYVKSA